MPIAKTDDGVDLYYETTGDGVAIVFVHEFAGDIVSWEPQVQFFSSKFKCITYNARGYPPSSIPESVESYSQERAVSDLLSILDAAGVDKAHIVGLSMGAFATLHFGLSHSERALSLCVAGCGYGAELDVYESFSKESISNAKLIRDSGMEAFAREYALSAPRLPFKYSNPRGHDKFTQQLMEHSAIGSANTQAGVQARRPSLYNMQDQLKQLRVPTLILNGDEDKPSLRASLMLKEVIPSAGLMIVPNCGHTINLEATHLFNSTVFDFICYASSGRWPMREE